MLLACEQLGLVADQIDAIKALFSKECNKELLLRSGADVFVSKESGTVGGIREKIDGCQELGMDCIIISRPIVAYPQMVSSLLSAVVILSELALVSQSVSESLSTSLSASQSTSESLSASARQSELDLKTFLVE